MPFRATSLSLSGTDMSLGMSCWFPIGGWFPDVVRSVEDGNDINNVAANTYSVF
jgi:hypothetical protein